MHQHVMGRISRPAMTTSSQVGPIVNGMLTDVHEGRIFTHAI